MSRAVGYFCVLVWVAFLRGSGGNGGLTRPSQVAVVHLPAALSRHQASVSGCDVCAPFAQLWHQRQVPHGARRGLVCTARGVSQHGPDQTQPGGGSFFSGSVHGECFGTHRGLSWGGTSALSAACVAFNRRAGCEPVHCGSVPPVNRVEGNVPPNRAPRDTLAGRQLTGSAALQQQKPVPARGDTPARLSALKRSSGASPHASRQGSPHRTSA
jgi:hypothetical protein